LRTDPLELEIKAVPEPVVDETQAKVKHQTGFHARLRANPRLKSYKFPPLDLQAMETTGSYRILLNWKITKTRSSAR
jgi:hypothetical protein